MKPSVNYKSVDMIVSRAATERRLEFGLFVLGDLMGCRASGRQRRSATIRQCARCWRKANVIGSGG
jgi:hypothetical protein